MYPLPPLFCSRPVYNYFIEALEHMDTMDGLLQAAIAISMHGDPQTPPQVILEQMQSICETVQAQCYSQDPRALVAHLHDVMFDQMQYQGNAKHYDDPANSYLSQVLQTRKGIPITLSLIYVITAHDLGLQVVGINTPGHFLVALEMDTDILLVDPFNHGRVLTDDQAIEIVQTVTGHRVSDEADDLFEPATHRQWIERLINNLIMHYHRMGQQRDLSAMRELKRLIVDD
ncbi:MAG: transglutaminase family protein [Phycisphaeraceae bacterium]|nr:transglutaminase family protein [Phycisphaeraceae bacterium]